MASPTYTTSVGVPVSEPHAAVRVGTLGPLILQDFHSIELLAHFAHERIPERVVHAKAAGAHGYFELTDSLSDITSSKFFTQVETRHALTARLSTIAGELGSADTARDTHGFAIKIRTDEGIFDWVFLNTPVFFIRDPAKLPPLAHCTKRNPQTHLHDPDAFWDFLTQNPETAHQAIILFTDRGTPDGYHRQHGFSVNTYKFVKSDGSFVYTKIHVKADGGFKTLDSATARRLSGENPDYGIRGLFEDIAAQRFPSWTVYIQTMTPAQAEQFHYNVLDPTKSWPQREYPLRRVGKLVLNKNVENYFAEVEQIAFSPANIVPYFEPSADPVLQARFFVYAETQRYRLGVNFNQLLINKSKDPVANFQRDGFMAIDNQGSRPNYKSSIQPLTYITNNGAIYGRPRDADREARHERWVGSAYWDLVQATEQDFEQPRDLVVNVLTEPQRQRLVDNIADNLRGVKNAEIKKRALSYLASVHQELSNRVANAIGHARENPLQGLLPNPPVRFRTRQTCT